MVNRKALFDEDSLFCQLVKGNSEICKLVKGNSDIRQLFRICRIMGTPKEDTWPGITGLPNFKVFTPHFPECVAKDHATIVPNLDKLGLDLLRKMLSVHPSNRITAKLAMEHEYFKDIRGVHGSNLARPLSRNGLMLRPVNRTIKDVNLL